MTYPQHDIMFTPKAVRTVDAGALARYHAPRRQDAYLGEAVDNPVRWTVRVSKETDVAVRTFLAQRGMKKGDLAKFVEEAVRWRVLDQTVAETKARNASASAADIDAAIDEALAAVRAERFDPHGG